MPEQAPLLVRYFDRDRPSFVVRVVSERNSWKRDFFVHREAMLVSQRFVRVEASGSRDLCDDDDNDNDETDEEIVIDENSRKRRRVNDGLVPLYVFHTSSLYSYDLLFHNGNGSDVFEWLLLHMYSYTMTDKSLWNDPQQCPSCDLLWKFIRRGRIADVSETITCTDIFDKTVGQYLIVLYELMLWFECPDEMRDHLEEFLVFQGLFTHKTSDWFPVMRRFFSPRHIPIISLLEDVCSSLLWSQEPSATPCLTLPPSARHSPRELSSQLQTFGHSHHYCDNSELVTLNQDMSAQFLDNFTCSLWIDEMPLIMYMDTSLPYTCFPLNHCSCNHLTEAILYRHTPSIVADNASAYDFSFGLTRDERYLDQVIVENESAESILLRSPQLMLRITWSVDEKEHLSITVSTTYSNTHGAHPSIDIDVGVLNVFTSEHLGFFSNSWDGSLSFPHEHIGKQAPPFTKYNAMTSIHSSLGVDADEYEVARSFSEKRTRRRFTTVNTWKLDMRKLRAGEGTRGWHEYDNADEVGSDNSDLLGPNPVVRPPRLFVMRGSVLFDIPEFPQTQ